MCESSGAQCFVLGLNQASAPEDCRLMWPISSDYSCMVTVSLKHTCVRKHSGKNKKRITGRKSLRMWFTHLFISVCFAKSASGLSLRFPFFPLLFVGLRFLFLVPNVSHALCILLADPLRPSAPHYPFLLC